MVGVGGEGPGHQRRRQGQATPGLGASRKLQASSAVGRVVGRGRWCFADPAHLEDAASSPGVKRKGGASTFLYSGTRQTGQVEIMRSILLWAKALSPTDMQDLKVAALCRGGAILCSTQGYTEGTGSPREERPHPRSLPQYHPDQGLPSLKIWLFPQCPRETAI